MGNLLEHAKKEMKIAGLYDKDSDYGGMLATAIEKLISTHEKEGHSGMSNGMVVSLFSKLARFETITPLKGTDDEWGEIYQYGERESCQQNNRNSAVFKDDKGTYYLSAIVFREEDGSTFTSGGSVELSDGSNIESAQYFDMPFNPKTFYVDVISERFDKLPDGTLKPNPEGDWWEHKVKDESQLDEVYKIYKR
jgi:hypothetical protein